ncbi:MAG: hypothetical protein LBB38_04130 [Puniceicoccales bacterium]|jgi:hypothetical protein|nr:hypothetical protein [Puniceicoccales bacterium]
MTGAVSNGTHGHRLCTFFEFVISTTIVDIALKKVSTELKCAVSRSRAIKAMPQAISFGERTSGIVLKAIIYVLSFGIVYLIKCQKEKSFATGDSVNYYVWLFLRDFNTTSELAAANSTEPTKTHSSMAANQRQQQPQPQQPPPVAGTPPQQTATPIGGAAVQTVHQPATVPAATTPPAPPVVSQNPPPKSIASGGSVCEGEVKAHKPKASEQTPAKQVAPAPPAAQEPEREKDIGQIAELQTAMNEAFPLLESFRGECNGKSSFLCRLGVNLADSAMRCERNGTIHLMTGNRRTTKMLVDDLRRFSAATAIGDRVDVLKDLFANVTNTEGVSFVQSAMIESTYWWTVLFARPLLGRMFENLIASIVDERSKNAAWNHIKNTFAVIADAVGLLHTFGQTYKHGNTCSGFVPEWEQIFEFVDAMEKLEQSASDPNKYPASYCKRIKKIACARLRRTNKSIDFNVLKEKFDRLCTCRDGAIKRRPAFSELRALLLPQ